MTDTKVTREFIKTTLEQQFKRLADKAAEDSNMSIGNMTQISLAMCSLVSDIALLTSESRIGFLNIPSSTDEKKQATPSNTERLIDSKIADARQKILDVIYYDTSSLMDSKIAHAKESILDEITNAILKATTFQSTPLKGHEKNSSEHDNSKVTIPLDLNTSAIDDAQEKADKLKTSLIDIHELIQKVYYSRFLPDTSVIDDAQKKVDKLKTSFHEVQELILKNHSDTD